MSATKAGAIPAYEPVLQFWFGSGNAAEIASRQSNLWWGKSTTADNDIRERFSSLRSRALDGELSSHADNSP
ncbi:MAG TPA: DUF924 family protein, partial [Steroidobacteraceae bacterium]|nr:DUF924 family protein [Steroidobacteraceae bacterium]